MTDRDRERALELQRRGLRDWIAVLAASSPGASLFERDGVTAAVVPACPRRSIVNSITYTDAGALAEQLDDLTAAFECAGVEAWLVWVHDFDPEARSALDAAGYVLDATPSAMTVALDSNELPQPGDLDWDMEATGADLGRLNDLAYGLQAPNGLAPGLADPPADPAVRLYRARDGDEVGCVAGTIDHGDDLGVYFVATHPDHRRLGLATRLMAIAMREARARGLATASLQSSAAGEPIYARLGFERRFRFEMHERRPE